jgi:hypothetical protein
MGSRGCWWWTRKSGVCIYVYMCVCAVLCSIVCVYGVKRMLVVDPQVRCVYVCMCVLYSIVCVYGVKRMLVVDPQVRCVYVLYYVV